MEGEKLMHLNVRTMKVSEGRNPSDTKTVTTKSPDSTVQKPGYTMSQDSDFAMPLPTSVGEENVILRTMDYGMFKFDPLNRAIRQDKLDRLYDAVREKNLLHLFPIVVGQDRTVIDGQHRLKVAEALDVYIYYIVSAQMQIEDAAMVNANVSTWRGVDYLDYWGNKGLPDYLQFREFWAEHPFLTFSLALKMLSYGGNNYSGMGSSSSLTFIFNKGYFRIADISLARRVAKMAESFAPWVPFWKETNFVSALLNLAVNPVYDHARMMQKMGYLSVRLVKCADVRGYIQVIEGIYNHKASDGSKVHFMIANKARGNAKKRQ